MFNLLRRSSKKKKKSNQEKSPKAARYSAGVVPEARAASSDSDKAQRTASIERYRSYNEWQRERERERECERERQRDERRIGLPTHAFAGKTFTRAEIEEFDDLKDLEEDEYDYCDDDDDARSDESGGLATAGRKSLLAERGAAAVNERCSYFRSKRIDDEGEREVGDKLNLAKTTAANNTLTANEEIAAFARGGGVVAATGSVASSALPNKAATLRSNDFNVDIINKFSSNPSKLDVHNVVGHECEDDVDRTARTYAVRDAADCGEQELLNRQGSSNAEAVWQGRTLPVVTSVNYNKNDRCANRSINDTEQRGYIQQIASSAARAENVERAVAAAADSENRFRHGDGNGNRHKSEAFHGDEQTALATDTASAAATNEVKYRNLEKTNKTPKVQKSHEAKRQSRLSLTLGLNLKGARSKSITDVSAATADSSSVTGYYSGSSSCSGRGPGKRSQLGKAFRYSFLRGRSKSSDTETPYEEDDSAVSVFENSKTERSVNGVGSKAFKKSKEFLSDLFMARGRNHNRNRNTQPQVQSAAQNQHLHTQQQQQQKLAQLQQQKQQQGTAKDARTLAPVSAPTNVNKNSHPHHNQQYKQNRNNYYNNSSPTGPVKVMQNDQNNSASTHLDLISDPSYASTNSYQITRSNNSAKNVSRTREDEERQRRSNSAGEQQLSARADSMHAGLRARSADPQWSVRETGAQSESKVNDEESTAQRLKAACGSKCDVIREIRAELNGTFKTAGTDNNNAEQPNDRAGCTADDLPKNISNNASKQNETSKFAGEVCIIESDVEVEEPDAIILCKSDDKVGINSDFNGNQCNTEVTTCSAASEAPHSAFPLTATTNASVPTNNATNDREATDVPSSIPTFPPWSVCPSDAASMGQTNAKSSEATPSSNADTASAYRETVLPQTNSSDVSASVDDAPRVPILPKITVVDCSGSSNGQENSLAGSPVEQEVFYDFENEPATTKRESAGVEISAVDANVEDIEDDEVFHDQEIPATVYQPKWSLRYNHRKLENVPEQEENEEASDAKYAANDGDADSLADSDSEGIEAGADIDVTKIDNLDIEYEDSQHFDSPERSTLKSANTSDSNLSNSYPDSGISGIDSHSSSTSSYSRRHSSSDNETRATRSTKSGSPIMLQHYSNNNNRQQQQHAQSLAQQHLPFVRDGNSTDCDESLMQCDDLDYLAEAVDPNERLVCIESISLPDVVVESTTGSSVANASASTATSPSKGDSEQIININGATGNSIGNVHFIPIHVEGSAPATPKRRSLDDIVLGSGGGINKSFAHMSGLHQKSTVEIIEEDSELTNGSSNGYQSKENDATVEKLRRELIEQKSRYNTQIGDAQKNVQNLQNKVSEMQAKIEKLEQEMSAKAWNVERLQGELRAAQKDDDFVRKRLKLLEDEKTNLRHKYSENEDEFRKKYEELETQYQELEAKYNETKSLASNLQTQLATAQTEAEEWRKAVETIRGELEAHIQILKNALENSEAERKICQDKWQKEFEMLRTQNQDREENLMADCEWQLREIRLQAKDKTDKLLQERQLALERTEQLHNELEERKQEVAGLKVYQAEVKSLRGVVVEQESAIKTLMQQIDNIKSELQTANTNLEEQMKAVKKIKTQCDNALCDKEREVVHRINEVRHQAAVFWEDKLYTEMTRLKTELESVYVDERREALDKLQAEHIEELRALTTRYTANEDELRTELTEVQERFERKSEEFTEMRDKSDNSLLQMRMHLDRADREYQNAMCREEERREALEANLRKEFDAEREEMEEKFRERLSQVKEEFAKELQDATQEMRQKQQKELEQQKAKLQAEKEEALQELSDRHRKKLAAVEEQINISYAIRGVFANAESFASSASSTSSLVLTALYVLAQRSYPYILPSLFVLYLTMSPIITLACLISHIIAMLFIRYRYLLNGN
ncbi:PREDICTED: uncharacterized protein LOC108975007 isoform X2 [Bactrocera latifrons]|uniref:uncharacterized protein LOC108975007 isoform X2 n=1 Tax=Bactrocera latifrons TaxID=174628 RepID=UPI0008DC7CF1|nr:PREDICTED: uncharacterized protein LOC108975007 isoform X2 [Bactrocera latifrons]